VGGHTFDTWERIPAEFLEWLRCGVPRKRRPSFMVLELVGRFIAQTIRPKRGYSNEAYSQIVGRLHGVVTFAQVQAAMRVLVPAVFVRIKNPTRGENGQRGRAAHYAFNPDLDEIVEGFRCGADPQPIQQESVWDEYPIGEGSEPNQSGMDTQSVWDDVESVRAQAQPSYRSPNTDIQYLVAPIDGANRERAKKLIAKQSEGHIQGQQVPRRRLGEVTLDQAVSNVLADVFAFRNQLRQ